MEDLLTGGSPTAQTEPDPRIIQANERTLLAWIRTGLGVMAFGFVVARMGVWLRAVQPENVHGGRSVLFGVAILALSAVSLVLSALRSHRNHRAILRREALVYGHRSALLLALSLAAVGTSLAVYLALV